MFCTSVALRCVARAGKISQLYFDTRCGEIRCNAQEMQSQRYNKKYWLKNRNKKFIVQVYVVGQTTRKVKFNSDRLCLFCWFHPTSNVPWTIVAWSSIDSFVMWPLMPSIPTGSQQEAEFDHKSCCEFFVNDAFVNIEVQVEVGTEFKRVDNDGS